MQGWLVIPVSLAYLGVLFLIAWYGDRQTRWLANWRPWIYSLSIAVYVPRGRFTAQSGRRVSILGRFCLSISPRS